jgi:hypothetical protein
MDPATIALIFQLLDLAIKEAPEMMNLINEFKAAFGSHECTQEAMKQMNAETLQASNEALAILLPLLAAKKAA